MPTFKDANDREWTIKLDAPIVLRIRSTTCDVPNCKHLQGCGCTGVDLADLTGETQRQLHRDVVLLVNTLYLLCQPEAQRQGITDEQFGACLVGDAIRRATIAMDEAIADFFPEETRAILRAVCAKDAEVRTLGMELALKKINDPNLAQKFLAAMEAQLDEKVKALLTPSSSATSSPAS
ncbi:MAG: hypothetical protein AB7E98_06000 [Pirellulales bacterium]